MSIRREVVGNEDDLSLIGERIAAARVKRGLTQEGLSKLTPLTRNTIWRIEAGQQIPTIDSTVRIAVALNVELRAIAPTYADQLEAIGVTPRGPIAASRRTERDLTTTAVSRSRSNRAKQRKQTARAKRRTSWSSHLAA